MKQVIGMGVMLLAIAVVATAGGCSAESPPVWQGPGNSANATGGVGTGAEGTAAGATTATPASGAGSAVAPPAPGVGGAAAANPAATTTADPATTIEVPVINGDPTAPQPTATTAPGDPSTPVVEPPITYPRPCSDLYEETIVPTFDVEIAPEEWQGMQRDCQDEIKAYRPIVFRFAGQVVDAMMRLKGNWSWSCEKMQFVISFNEVDSDGRYRGLRKIVLDAPWYDPTMLHERLAFFYMKQHGVPSSCINHARLNINGEYYGVYANVERVDREYLERHFEDPDGNLFKEGTELTTNEDTGSTATVDAFWAANSVAELEALVDVPQALAVWAGLAMVPDPDSYWAGVEINFYLYEHPTAGLLFLPYDMDISFAENVWPNLVEADPITYEHEQWLREEQAEILLSDPTWCEVYQAAVERARAAYDVDLLVSKLDAWSAQIATAVAEDPNRTFTTQEHEQALSALRTFPSRRAAFVDTWLQQSHCPAQWPGRRSSF